MKIGTSSWFVAIVAVLLAGCGDVAGPGDTPAAISASALADHVDNPGQTPMGP